MRRARDLLFYILPIQHRGRRETKIDALSAPSPSIYTAVPRIGNAPLIAGKTGKPALKNDISPVGILSKCIAVSSDKPTALWRSFSAYTKPSNISSWMRSRWTGTTLPPRPAFAMWLRIFRRCRAGRSMGRIRVHGVGEIAQMGMMEAISRILRWRSVRKGKFHRRRMNLAKRIERDIRSKLCAGREFFGGFSFPL